MTDRALERMDGQFDALYSATGRPSIVPERLIRGLLLQVLYSVHSERQLIEQLDYNLLFRWFVGLEMDDEVWDVTVFTKNRERLINGEVSQGLLASVLVQARENNLLSEEHFAPYGGEVLLRDKVESKTDPEARLFKKATADKSVPSYQGNVLMESRSGLVVAAEASQSATNAEREVALDLVDQVLDSAQSRNPEHQLTLGADTQYQDEKFIEALRQRAIAPHVSEYVKGNLGKNSLNEAERADPRRSISQRKRKLIEQVFGWSKLDRPLRQVKLRGLDRMDWFFRLAITAFDLVRMRRLIPFSA
jgi:hypothetical protein